jgi:hypothetical protein
MKKITLLTCILLATQFVYSQEAITVSGGDVIGPEGSGTYSVGQTFYTTNTAASGSVSQGVQQPFEFSVVDITKPTAIAKDITVQLDAAGSATITAAQINNVSTDNVAETGKNFIFEIPFGNFFEFKEILYKRGNKRRTRSECLNMKNKKVYLFNQNVAVKQYNS